MTTCPCCGFSFKGDLRSGCQTCGARAVGEPLPKPQHELPAYGRPLLLVATGVLMILGFLAETIIALVERVPLSFGFWSWIAAGETGAWRLKWVFVPLTFVVLWGGRRIYQTMMQTPARFVGLTMARRGLLASALVCLTIATSIGVTIPARLRQRQIGIQAGLNAQAYTIERALREYRALYGTLPAELSDLKDRLPDPDGSIAAALPEAVLNNDLGAYPVYKPSGPDLAAIKEKPRALRGAVIRTASASTPPDDLGGGVSFTNYDLRLPGEDKILGNDDDLIVRDGVIMTVAEAKENVKPAGVTARSRKP